MNNKGFTLVELVAVIVILGILALVGFEALDSINKNNKENTYKVQRENIVSAAISYVPTSCYTDSTSCVSLPTKFASECGSSTSSDCYASVTLKQLFDAGVLDGEDPSTGKLIIKNSMNGKCYNPTASYVSIRMYKNKTELNNDSNVTKERDKKDREVIVGKLDGNYYYELHESYVECEG